MLKKIQQTQAGWGMAILRIVLGVIFIREGSGKLLGWFGQGGFAVACQYFTELGIPFPVFNTFLVSSTEFFAGLALFVGFLTRLAVIPLSITMVVAIFTAHLGSGWSYPVLIMAVCAALLQTGSGPLSLDKGMTHS